MQRTLDESISLHFYFDDIIVRDKGLMISSDFQVLGHFQITFSLDINSDIFKELQR
jgi:hypothetical protein